MELYTALYTRRTIRDFEQLDGAPRPLDPELIHRLINAGFSAPTNNHMREWHFVLLNDLEKRSELLTRVIHPLDRPHSEQIINKWGLSDRAQREMYLDAIPRQFSMLANSGCLLLPFYRQPVPLLNPLTLSDLNPFASIWLCIENILLAAASEGVFGVVRIPAEDESRIVRKTLNVPEGYEFPCWLALGYPAADAIRARQNPINITDRIHQDSW